MARIRNIKPDFYTHEDLNDLENNFPELRPMLVFSGLWNQCEYSGVFLWSTRKLKLAILPFVEFDIEKSLTMLEKHGFILRYQNGGKNYGYVINFTKYQAISGSEKTAGLRYPLPGDVNSKSNDVIMTEPGTTNDVTMTEPVESLKSQTTADLGLRTKDLGQKTKDTFSFSPFLNQNTFGVADPPEKNYSDIFEQVKARWKEVIGQETRENLFTVSPPKREKFINTLKNYSLEEIFNAIGNYQYARDHPDKFNIGGRVYGSLYGFLENGVCQFFLDNVTKDNFRKAKNDK
jgi:hypothetical protein